MDERFQAILDNLPPKPPRSRLEPYWDLIRELRRRGRTYRDIAQLLAEKFEVAVSPSTVHDFVRVRTRRRQRPPQVESIAGDAVASETPPPRMDGNAVTATEISERIEAVRQRPAPEKASRRRFEYDESAPLKLVPKGDQEEE
jgi:IS30 family transposase